MRPAPAVWLKQNCHPGFMYGRGSLVASSRRFLISTGCGVDRAPHQIPLFRKLSEVTGGLGFVEQHGIFESGLAHEHCGLALHPRRVVLEKVDEKDEYWENLDAAIA